MELFQILECSGDITSCCSDYSIANLLWVIQTGFGMITVIVPIILIVMATIQFTKMMINPDEKGNKQTLMYKFVSAVLVFFLPWAVNLVVHFTNYADITSFEIGRCWEAATTIHTTLESTSYTESSTDDGTKNSLNPDGEYEEGKGESTTASGKAEDIIEYAKQQIGTPYVYGAKDLSYAVDCSGFVEQVFDHFGITASSPAANQASLGTAIGSISDAQPGDLLGFGNGTHIAIYLGNDQFIHSSGDSSCTDSNPCTAAMGKGVKVSTLSTYYTSPTAIRRII